MEKEIEEFLQRRGIWAKPLIIKEKTQEKTTIKNKIINELRELKKTFVFAASTITFVTICHMMWGALLHSYDPLDTFSLIFLNNLLVAFALRGFRVTAKTLNKKLEWPLVVGAFVFIAILRPLVTMGLGDFIKLWSSEWGWVLLEITGIAGIVFLNFSVGPYQSRRIKIGRFEGVTAEMNYTYTDVHALLVFAVFIAIVAAIETVRIMGWWIW
jgi:hypothetical protein